MRDDDLREVLIQLRYARLKIEKIEGELTTRPPYVVFSKELHTSVDLVIGALKSAKSYLKEKEKKKK